MAKQLLFLYLLASGFMNATIAYSAGTYEFLMLTEGLPLGDRNSPVLAIMDLSGESPHDHTDIESLVFTQQADEYLGITGVYTGEFDSTYGLNRIIETKDNSLGSTADDPSTIGSLIIDGDPSVGVNAPPFFSTGEKFLLLSFFNEEETFSYIGSPPTNRTVTGRWVLIPEPSSVCLIASALLLGLVSRGRRECLRECKKRRRQWLR